MIRLEIYPTGSSTPLVPHLPATLSFEMIRENPLFNRRGDYTYDIDISLRDPHNRAIYNHIDRLTATSRPQNRRARLICDGRVIADGTEVVLKKESESVKIQILAGNSELNYLTADSNLKIREMNFGTIATPTVSQAGADAFKIYPEVNHAFPKGVSVVAQEGIDITECSFYNECDNQNGLMVYESGTELRPMPFVLYYVEKFVELLGYTIGTNCLRNEPRWCRLIHIHGYQTLEYAKMLPDWSAEEFLENVEQFFNCVFLVNPTSKVVDIVTFGSFIDETSPIEMEDKDVLDEHIRDYEKTTDDFLHHYDNLAYELPGGGYWKITSLDETVLKMCKTVDKTFAQVEAMEIEDCEWMIFHSIDPDLQFVRINEKVTTPFSTVDTPYKRYIVNQFAPHRGESEVQAVLKIIPVRTLLWHSSVSRIYPVAELLDLKSVSEFKEAISSRISEVTVDNLQVCMYVIDGNSFGYNAADHSLYRISSITPVCVTALDYMDTVEGMHVHLPTYTGRTDLTLELNGDYGLYETHFKADDVNVEEAYTIKLRSKRIYDLRRPFLIHGRLFICQQLKYTYADGRQHPIVEGTFYPYI